MYKKIICLFTAVIIVFVFCTGCSIKGTKRDLASLAIVIGLAIDKSEGKNQGFEGYFFKHRKSFFNKHDMKYYKLV